MLAGVTWSDYRDPATAGRNGTRTDIGARITYAFNDKTNVFVFGQTTAHLKGDRVRNDRIGVGAEFELTDSLSITGDISTGTSGIGGSSADSLMKSRRTTSPGLATGLIRIVTKSGTRAQPFRAAIQVSLSRAHAAR